MSRITVYAIHAPAADLLASVTEQMMQLGAPTIRVVDCGDHYMALEGSHPLAAAKALDMIPELVIHQQHDMIDITDFDWHDAANWCGTLYPAGEVAGELFCPRQSIDYTFGE